MQARLLSIEKKYKRFLEIGWNEPFQTCRGKLWVNRILACRWSASGSPRGIQLKGELRVGTSVFVRVTAERIDLWSAETNNLEFFSELLEILLDTDAD